MAGTFAPNTPGAVGDVAAGWTIQEDASSHVPGDGSGSAGIVNLAAESMTNATFLQDNPSTFTVTKNDGTTFGSISGSVASVSTRGLMTSITQATGLNNFAVDRTIPPVSSGHPSAAIDLAVQLVGSKFCNLTYPGGVYWSGRGHNSGFDYQGNLVYAVDNSTNVAVTASLLNFIQQNVNIDNALTITQYNTTAGFPRALYATGSSPTTTPGKRTIVMLHNNTGNYCWFTATYGPANAANNTGKSLRVYIDVVAQTMNITGNYYTGGILTNVSQSVSIASVLATSTAVQLIVDMNWVDSATFNLTAYVAAQTALGTVVSLSTGNLTTGNDGAGYRWQAAGIMTDFYELDADQTFTPSALMVTYANSGNFYGVTAAMTPATNYVGAPFVGYSGSVWDYLNQVSSATGVDFYYTSGLISVRPTGSVPIVVESFEPSPSLSVNNQGVAQNVNIKNYNSSVVQNQIVYDAASGNDTWSFAAGQTTTNIITTQNSVELVLDPTPADDYASFHFFRDLSVNGGIAANTRTNVVKNPDFEDGTTASWAVFGSATIANSTARATQGTHSLAVTTSTGSSGTQNVPALSTAYRGLSVVGSVDLFIPSTRIVTAQIWYNNGGNVALGSATSSTGTGAWVRVPLPAVTIPTDAASEPFIVLTSPAGTSFVYNVDMVNVEVGSNAITPFNGNTPSTATLNYSWTGTFNASSSTATPNGYSGSYVVSDSTNAIIPSYTWTAYGGSVNLSLIDSGHIQMVVIAPSIPGFVGPYSMSVVNPTGTFDKALVIVGSGVTSSPSIINFATGADSTYVSTLQSGDIDNVAIGSSARHFTAAMWAGSIHGGPRLQLTASVPIETFSAFGSFGGGTFFYQSQRWRIINATISNMMVDITCYPYTTAGDFETVWSGKIISDEETAWSGKRNDDFNIQPLNLAP